VWTEDEDRRLWTGYCDKQLSLEQVGSGLGRSVNSTRARIEYLKAMHAGAEQAERRIAEWIRGRPGLEMEVAADLIEAREYLPMELR